MGKVLECDKVDPSSGCKYVMRGENDEEIIKKAKEHIKSHGIREMTTELMSKIRAAIHTA